MFNLSPMERKAMISSLLHSLNDVREKRMSYEWAKDQEEAEPHANECYEGLRIMENRYHSLIKKIQEL